MAPPVMPTTARLLKEQYPLFEDMFWVPCAIHLLALFMEDEVKQALMKELLSDAKLIASTHRTGAPNKLLATYVPHGRGVSQKILL